MIMATASFRDFRYRMNKRDVLIKEVKKRHCIWDKRSSEYKHRDLCHQAWKEVSTACKMDVESCKKLWKNLHDQFRRNYQLAAKRALENPSGEKSDMQDITVKWTYFKSLLFLKDFVTHRYDSTNIDNLRNPEEVNDDDQDSNFPCQISDEQVTEFKQETITAITDDSTISDDQITEIKQEMLADKSISTIHEVETTPGPSRFERLEPPEIDYDDTIITSDRTYNQDTRMVLLESPRPLKRIKFSSEEMVGTLVRELEHANKELSKRRVECSDDKFANYVADLIGKVPRSMRAHCEFQVIKLINSYMDYDGVELKEH